MTERITITLIHFTFFVLNIGTEAQVELVDSTAFSFHQHKPTHVYGLYSRNSFWEKRTTVRKHSGSVFIVTAGASFYTQDHGAFSEPGWEQGYETLLRKKLSENLKLLEEQVRVQLMQISQEANLLRFYILTWSPNCTTTFLKRQICLRCWEGMLVNKQ